MGKSQKGKKRRDMLLKFDAKLPFNTTLTLAQQNESRFFGRYFAHSISFPVFFPCRIVVVFDATADSHFDILCNGILL